MARPPSRSYYFTIGATQVFEEMSVLRPRLAGSTIALKEYLESAVLR